MKDKLEIESLKLSSDCIFAKMTPVTADDLKVVGTTKRHGGPLGISVVNTPKNGVRVTFSKALFESLGNPERIQFVTDDDYLYVGAIIPFSTESIPFSSGKGTNIVYHRGFVTYLTNRFNLDFSERTSKSFRDVEIGTQDYEGEKLTYAKINMKN